MVPPPYNNNVSEQFKISLVRMMRSHAYVQWTLFVLFLEIKVWHSQMIRKSLPRLWNIRFESASWLLTYWFWIQQSQSISIFKSQRKQNKQFCACSKLLMHTSSSSYHDIAENDHLFFFVIILTSQPGSFLETSLGCLTQTRWSFHQTTSQYMTCPKLCTYTHIYLYMYM